VKAYIINLIDRADRWASAELQLEGGRTEYVRVDAVDARKISSEDSSYLTKSVLAIWKSHMRAMENFLNSKEEHAIILEDDFEFTRNFSLDKLEELLCSDFDYLQLGYLTESRMEWIDIRYSNSFDLFTKFLFWFHEKFPDLGKPFGEKYLVKKQKGIARRFVLDDIRAGAHAYIINRKFAKIILELNQPPFLSTDLMYISLGQMRYFKMARLRTSIISQSKSKSSVENRFMN
jgi:GR25 family glycosyltransferase involved in LPS biosynthesis